MGTPPLYYNYFYYPTLWGTSCSSNDYDVSYSYNTTYIPGISNGYSKKKEETKKEKIQRVAKEKMLASWKTYNEKTLKIIDVKNLCKPQHRLTHLGRKFI